MTKILEELTGKIQDKSAQIGVIGLGYVGLPLVLRFCEEGFNVTGFDVDAVKVTALCEGRSYIKHIPSASIEKITGNGNFTATTVMAGLADCEAVIICVPTPLNKTREPEMRYVVETAEIIARHLRAGQLISLESTTYPGTTEELLQSRFEEKGLLAGKDFFLVFSPEREDPGRKDFSTSTIPKVVGGTTPACLKVGSLLYSQVIEKVVEVSSTKAAEMTKLLENIYRCVNIALVNELKMLTERMDIDIWEVIRASSTKPFGFQPFYPGPGLGGHCIPIDPFYLSWKARQFDFSTKFIELAGEINAQMPFYVVGKVFEALNLQSKAIKGSRILVLGLAYKKDVDDVRESPSLVLIELLQKLGAEVDYNDPHVPATHKMRNHDLEMRSIELNDRNISSYDCVLIATDHSDYDYEWIVKHSSVIVDTRGVTNDIKCENVLRA
ncbi:UDP-N-acetyl-D-glucosamine 6-dehydrogenase [hydrothermal vent metagenome]|uniref:UDP-N-acetyl-D-glucosamine 6-dehydrogenase n=1 Tax=hydrothermal vent metagenome TaxID=652676 RepID=A0A3B0V4U6_9ZZZZ